MPWIGSEQGTMASSPCVATHRRGPSTDPASAWLGGSLREVAGDAGRADREPGARRGGEPGRIDRAPAENSTQALRFEVTVSASSIICPDCAVDLQEFGVSMASRYRIVVGE